MTVSSSYIEFCLMAEVSIINRLDTIPVEMGVCGGMCRHTGKMTVSKPRREAWNKCFPQSPRKESILLTP